MACAFFYQSLYKWPSIIHKAWQGYVYFYISFPEYSKKSYKEISGISKEKVPWNLAPVNKHILTSWFNEKSLHSRRFASNKLNLLQELFSSTSPRDLSRQSVKSVQIRSYFWSVFSCISTEYGYLLRIQSEYRKIRTRNNSVFWHFLKQWGLLQTSKIEKFSIKVDD